MEKIENLKQLLELNEGLELITDLEGFAVNYAISRTIAKSKEFVQSAEKEKKKVIDITKPFSDEVEELVEKMSAGNQIVGPNGQMISKVPDDKMPEYLIKLAALKQKHKKNIDKQAKLYSEYLTFLENTPVTGFEIYGVSINDVPKNINTRQMKYLYPIIIE